MFALFSCQHLAEWMNFILSLQLLCSKNCVEGTTVKYLAGIFLSINHVTFNKPCSRSVFRICHLEIRIISDVYLLLEII